jgi:hypothetical protein
MRSTILVVGLILLTAGCLATEQSLRQKGLVPQTQQELEARFSKPVKARFDTGTGGRGTVSYTPDGTARVEYQGGVDTGRWQIRDGKICLTWTKIRDGKEACFSSFKTGPKDYAAFNADGSLNSTSTDID